MYFKHKQNRLLALNQKITLNENFYSKIIERNICVTVYRVAKKNPTKNNLDNLPKTQKHNFLGSLIDTYIENLVHIHIMLC